MKTLVIAGRRVTRSRFETLGWERRFNLLRPQSWDVAFAIALAICLAAASRTLVG